MIQVVKLWPGELWKVMPMAGMKSRTSESYPLRFFEARRGFLLDLVFFGLSATAKSRRFVATHPGLLTWRPQPIPNPSEGTFSAIVEPAGLYGPSPTCTHVTKEESLTTE